MGMAATGKSMRVDEVSFFEFDNGRVAHMWGLEDTWERFRPLGELPS
jgi:hypothetical protein